MKLISWVPRRAIFSSSLLAANVRRQSKTVREGSQLRTDQRRNFLCPEHPVAIPLARPDPALW